MFTLDPLRDPRWARFVDRHPRASIFHTAGWLEALHRTYGYEPVVFTTTPATEELKNGLVFCRVDSWLTGRRLVSLPFSDHCEPLVDASEDWELLRTSVIDVARWQDCKYVEMRPLQEIKLSPNGSAEMAQSQAFLLHTLDLRPELATLYQGFHRKSVQQPIKRAERERLCCEQGRSPELLRQFYRLLVLTRRRHRLPPQPLEWFANLVDCLGDRLTIWVASRDGQPIASILTLFFNRRIYYKYGCADGKFHNLGGTQLLLWRAIQAGKQRGAHFLDLGRSEIDHPGLALFKEHWGSSRFRIAYYRYPPARHEHALRKWTGRMAGYAFARLPDSLLATAGRFLYPHIG
jgi:CelD/BcsL family acetyltransferase involved in cellulose biosynthesis